MSAHFCCKSYIRRHRLAFCKTDTSYQRVACGSTQKVLGISSGVDSAKSIALASVSAVAEPRIDHLEKAAQFGDRTHPDPSRNGRVDLS